MLDQSATETAYDVLEHALILLEQGADLGLLGTLPGLEEDGEDEDGRLFFGFSSGVPVIIDCDEDGARLQWTGTSADDCFEDFLMLLATYDPDARRSVAENGGYYSGRIQIGGAAYTYAFFDDVVVLGDAAPQDGTVLTLLAEDAEWSASPMSGRRAYG